MAKKTVLDWIDQHSQQLTRLSDKIWELAEVGLKEQQSAAALIATAKEHGFTVEEGVAGMPSAFVASFGSGHPVIAILGEYDALPGISQQAHYQKQPLHEGAAGHGCGHNLLGVAALGGAIAAKEAMVKHNLQGTVRYYGCPAEETLVGKVFMVRDGLFDDVDISMTWHPGTDNVLWSASSLAMNSAKFTFHGRSSHAAGDPENGRSALDAVELMNVGANYLREHVSTDARIHYVITNGGGEPNVVPPIA
ncbi:MAG: amidohydrolase [Bacillota bacterium]